MEAVKNNLILVLTGYVFMCGLASVGLLAVFLITNQITELTQIAF